jgi:hypothetical protein
MQLAGYMHNAMPHGSPSRGAAAQTPVLTLQVPEALQQLPIVLQSIVVPSDDVPPHGCPADART